MDRLTFPNDLYCIFSCSLNSFPPDDTALVAVVPLHVEVTVVSNGEDVWRHFANLLVGVEADLVGRVDGQQLIRVDGHQDGAGVRLHTKNTTRDCRSVTDNHCELKHSLIDSGQTEFKWI